MLPSTYPPFAPKTAALEVVYRLVNFEASCRGHLRTQDVVVQTSTVHA